MKYIFCLIGFVFTAVYSGEEQFISDFVRDNELKGYVLFNPYSSFELLEKGVPGGDLSNVDVLLPSKSTVDGWAINVSDKTDAELREYIHAFIPRFQALDDSGFIINFETRNLNLFLQEFERYFGVQFVSVDDARNTNVVVKINRHMRAHELNNIFSLICLNLGLAVHPVEDKPGQYVLIKENRSYVRRRALSLGRKRTRIDDFEEVKIGVRLSQMIDEVRHEEISMLQYMLRLEMLEKDK
ncbi:MAG: hypothetical protein JJU05_01470 [Verrucomicrobia bacterium]|nr:hypothetical protein [Verrucomicrobiota bacterium]MCH8528276.1 hypothetical protein [Kiritimatiellia bacterium]